MKVIVNLFIVYAFMFIDLVKVFSFLNCLKLGGFVTIIDNEQYIKFTQSNNLSNPANIWVRQPIPFSDTQLSIQCIKNRDWNPEFLMFQKDEVIQKEINSLSYTNNVNHFQVKVDVKFLLIDVNQQDFILQIKSGSTIKQVKQLIGPGTNYCYEYYKNGNQCNDYCASNLYDSYASTSVTFDNHIDPDISLEFSSGSLNLNQFIGIYSLTISVNLCDDNCLICTGGANQCIQCKTAAEFINTTTKKCVNACSLGEYEDIDATILQQKVCKKCIFSNCDACNATACTQCKVGYYANAIGNCVKCLSLCGSCTNGMTCTSCAQGFYLDSSNICQQCQTGCKECSSQSICNKCQQKYYLLNDSCHNCLPNCKDCEDGTTCKYCENNYLIKKMVATMVADECVTDCGLSFFPSNDNSRCIYQDNSQCAEAIDVVNGCQGKKCSVNSPDNYANFQKECYKSCPDRYFKNQISFDQYSCSDCPSKCYTCSSLDLCLSCDIQYFIKSDGTKQYCEKCGDNCNYCTNESICTDCSDGNFLDNGVCLSTCPGSKYGQNKLCHNCTLSNCAKCENSNSCYTCEAGYVAIEGKCLQKCNYGEYREGSNPTCSNCLANCKDCTSGNTCDVCMDGFYLTNNVCKPCDSSCATCGGPLPNECLSCDSSKDLFLLQNKCIKTCPDGFYSAGYQLCQPCTDIGCAKCNTVNQCSICKLNSDFLTDDKECTKICPNDHQIFMDELNILNCLKIDCQLGYKQNKRVCEEYCGDGLIFNHQCDDGNSEKGDGCSDKCSIEPQFECSKPALNQPSFCKFILDYSLIQLDEANTFSIQFNTNVELKDQTFLKLSIESLSDDDFTYLITSIPNKQDKIKIQIKFEVQVPAHISIKVRNEQHDNYHVSLKDYNPSVEHILRKSEKTILIQSLYYPSESQKTLSQGIQKTGQILATSILVSILPITVLGSVNFVASIIDVSQLIYLHVYIDIKYPLILSDFYQIFTGFSFPFATNIFSYMIPDNLNRPSYDSFERNSTDATYLSNAGQHYSIMIITLVIHGILKLIGKKYQKVNEKTDKLFKYSIYHEVVMSTYLEIIFCTFLQWTNMYTELGIEYFNQFLMFVTFLIFFPIPFVAAYFMKKYYTQLKDENVKAKFGALWQGLKEEYVCSIYFIYIHFRKVIFSMIIIFMNHATIVQCAFLMIPPILLATLVVYKRPFLNKIENIKQIIQEVCLTAAALCLILLKKNDGEKESIRNNYSYAVIFFFATILIMHFICTMIELYQLLIKKSIVFMIKIIRKVWQKVKIEDYFTAKKNRQQQQNQKILIREIKVNQFGEFDEEKDALSNVPKSFNFDKEFGLVPSSSRGQISGRKSSHKFHNSFTKVNSHQSSLMDLSQDPNKAESIQDFKANQPSSFVYGQGQLVTFMDMNQEENPEESETQRGQNNKSTTILKQKNPTIEQTLNEYKNTQSNRKLRKPELKIQKQKEQQVDKQLLIDLQQQKTENFSPSQSRVGSIESPSQSPSGSPVNLIKQNSSKLIILEQSMVESNQNINIQSSKFEMGSINQSQHEFLSNMSNYRNNRKQKSLIRRTLKPIQTDNKEFNHKAVNLQSRDDLESRNNIDDSNMLQVSPDDRKIDNVNNNDSSYQVVNKVINKKGNQEFAQKMIKKQLNNKKSKLK